MHGKSPYPPDISRLPHLIFKTGALHFQHQLRQYVREDGVLSLRAHRGKGCQQCLSRQDFLGKVKPVDGQFEQFTPQDGNNFTCRLVSSYGVNTLTSTDFELLMPGQPHGRSPESLRAGSHEMLRSSPGQYCGMTQPNHVPQADVGSLVCHLGDILECTMEFTRAAHSSNPGGSDMFRSSVRYRLHFLLLEQNT